MKYYDLRMRYSTTINERAPAEQDLGRAFGNRQGPEDLPIIIVGKACFKQFKTGRSNRKGPVSSSFLIDVVDWSCRFSNLSITNTEDE